MYADHILGQILTQCQFSAIIGDYRRLQMIGLSILTQSYTAFHLLSFPLKFIYLKINSKIANNFNNIGKRANDRKMKNLHFSAKKGIFPQERSYVKNDRTEWVMSILI